MWSICCAMFLQSRPTDKQIATIMLATSIDEHILMLLDMQLCDSGSIHRMGLQQFNRYKHF